MHTVYIKLQKDGESVALVSFARYKTPQDVAAALWSSENRSTVMTSNAIIIRPSVDKPIKNIKKATKKLYPIIERFSHLPIYLLYSCEYEIKLSGNINKKADGLVSLEEDTVAVLHFLQTKEMQGFVIKSSAILKVPNDTTLFRTPSQEYSNAFLRVGNIQKSRYILNSIFFWCLPYLKNAGAILTDSWSITSTTLNISRLLARYVSRDENEVSQVVNHFHVNMLSTYYHGLRQLDKETKESLAPLQYKNDKKILFIISAVKTATSLVNIKKAIRDAGYENNVEYLSLYNLYSNVGINCLCELDEDFCRECDISFKSVSTPTPGFSIVPIDENNFFPLQTSDNLITIDKRCADISKEFFDYYSGLSAISCHRNAYFDNNTEVRHHGIYVDLLAILVSDRFNAKLETELEQLPQLPDYIVYPPHPQGHAFVSLVSEKLSIRFGRSPELLCFSELDILPKQMQKSYKEKLASLSKNSMVLVMDDVSVTGSRLFTYQKILLTSKFIGRIWYLIGVARPESDMKWDERRRTLLFNEARLAYVEKVILPDWNYTSCPWCREKEKLKEIIGNPGYQELKVSMMLGQRFNDLNNSSAQGLVNDLFFQLGRLPKPSFLGNAIFCSRSDINEADMAASVASSIQHLRNGIKGPDNGVQKLLRVNHPFYSIIHPEHFLNGDCRFFEPYIKACILRTALHSELYATEDANRQKQKNYILSFLKQEHIDDNNLSFFLYELYIAMKVGKIPKPDIDYNLRHVINSYFQTGKVQIASK